ARLGARGREAEAMDHVVEAPLEQAQHLLARPPLAPVRFLEVAAELPLEHAVDATHLLLLAEAHRVLGELDSPLPVLTGRVRPARVGALLGVAALTLQVELHALAAAELADGTNVAGHDLLPLQTRRRLGGRHPLCGIGVTSRISVTLKPAVWSARRALSRPA